MQSQNMGGYEEQQLEILQEQHSRILELLQTITDNLDNEFYQSHNILESSKGPAKTGKQKNPMFKTLGVRIYSINIGLIHSISQHLKSILKILEVTKVNNDGRSYLISYLNDQYKTKSYINNLEIEMDAIQFSQKNKFNTQIQLYKQQMRESFLSEVTSTCSNIYTVKLKSLQGQFYNEQGKNHKYLQIEDNDINLLKGFKHLSVLDLQQSVITDNAIELIRDEFYNIKEINLNGCYMLTDRCVKILTECSQLVNLRISQMNGLTTQALLEFIQNANNLNYLDITKNSEVNEEFLFSVQKSFSEHHSIVKWLQITSDFGIDLYINQLSYLTTSNPGEQITDQQFITLIGERPVKYTGIFFVNCQQLTKKSISTLLNKCQTSSLQRLSLQHFIRLTDSLVQEFTLAIPNLHYLDLSYCYNITDNSLFYLSKNLSLRELILIKCLSVTDEGIEHICLNMRPPKRVQQQYSPLKLKSLIKQQMVTNNHCCLIKLDLSYCNKITDKAIFAISEYCKSLKYLSISHCQQVTDKSIDDMSRSLRHLQSISLNYCEGLTDSSISMIATRLPNLNCLEIQWCEVSQKCVRYIAQNLNKLKILNLSHCPGVFSEELTLISKNIPNLEDLRLQSCVNLEENGMMTVGEYLSNLRILCVKECEMAVTDEFIKNFVGSNKNIQFLDISWCRNITNISMFHIAKGCFNLKHLNLNGCVEVDDRGIQWLSATVAPLQYLNLTLCSTLTDNALFYITHNLKELRSLSICELPQISDLGISSLSNLTKLEQLQLRGCTNITGISLIGLLYNLERLTELNISQCRSIEGQSLSKVCQFMGNIKMLQISEIQIDDYFLQELNAHCKKLTFLNLCYCHDVTDDGILKVIEHLPRLIKVELQSTNISDKTMRVIAQALNRRKMEKILVE